MALTGQSCTTEFNKRSAIAILFHKEGVENRDEIIALTRRRGCPLLVVILTCSPEETVRRIQDEERVAERKPQDPDLVGAKAWVPGASKCQPAGPANGENSRGVPLRRAAGDDVEIHGGPYLTSTEVS